MAPTAKTIEEYLQAVEPSFRAELERLRRIVHRIEPSVTESISYRMPTLTYKGRALVYLTASKKHMSFYPSSFAITDLADRLEGYDTTEHAIRFTLKDPLPEELVEDLVRVHIQAIDEGRH